MRRFLIALQFLTVLPVDIKGKIEEEEIGRSLAYFPIVGLLIGAFLALIAFISSPLPYMVRGILILVAWVFITGGVHMDGLADTCDGFYAKSRSREDILKIMRDSRIGTMGAAGITLLLLFKFAMLSTIPSEDLWKALIVVAVFARWSQALACCISQYARNEGKAKYFIEHAKKTDMLAGALLTLIICGFLMKEKGVILLVLLLAVIFLFIKYVKGKIGGMTGDTIGALNEVAEAAALFLSLMILR